MSFTSFPLIISYNGLSLNILVVMRNPKKNSLRLQLTSILGPVLSCKFYPQKMVTTNAYTRLTCFRCLHRVTDGCTFFAIQMALSNKTYANDTVYDNMLQQIFYLLQYSMQINRSDDIMTVIKFFFINYLVAVKKRITNFQLPLCQL